MSNECTCCGHCKQTKTASKPLLVVKLREDAITPTKYNDKAVGVDLKATEDTYVPRRGRKLIGTGLQLTAPEGTYLRLAARSTLSAQHGIEVGAGIIDPDYTGEVFVVLYNHTDEHVCFRKDTSIAQVIAEGYQLTHVVEVKADQKEVKTEIATGRQDSAGGKTNAPKKSKTKKQ